MTIGLGLSIASHSGLPPARIGEIAGLAEQAGFTSVFVAEGNGDALALCHPVIAATRHVQVGTAIVNAALRPPVLAAKTAAAWTTPPPAGSCSGWATATRSAAFRPPSLRRAPIRSRAR
ncbi:LLM class flavin-dependent oxidoreductase [Spirillospora sp. NPDC048911]|uniref:LLM class flavin-dependent oxidoreductase n=1 Tax=Spirillospora sp. NPDC048911 TaxID=3364527 RepID=UPI003723D492